MGKKGLSILLFMEHCQISFGQRKNGKEAKLPHNVMMPTLLSDCHNLHIYFLIILQHVTYKLNWNHNLLLAHHDHTETIITISQCCYPSKTIIISSNLKTP